jgi:DNA invertase Pin-like site-specific DNA recombinase
LELFEIGVDFSNSPCFNRCHPKYGNEVMPMPKDDSRLLGYVRVSTGHQNTDRQEEALLKEGVAKRDIYIDKQSGKDFSRPEYQKLKGQLVAGDTVVILDLDRLGRNYTEMSAEWYDIVKTRNCNIKIINFPLLNTASEKGGLEGQLVADIVFNLLSYVAQRERDHLLERQREGIEVAKKKGTKFGRPKIERPDNFTAVYARVQRHEITAREAMKQLGLKPNSYYRFVSEEMESTETQD